MKDVRQCSISSVAFTLEVDAYDTLYTYVESIRARYATNPDGEEILSDIEARIAELILSVHPADRVVAKPLVDNIIDQLGSVDEICPEEPTSAGDGDEASGDEATPNPEPKPKGKKGLYRNVDDAPIGGVCSGIAAYVGCNVGIVRAIALLLLLCGGASIWVYIVLWIVLPAAVTARQKLEMRGEPITVASIKEYYESFTENEKNRSFVSSALAVIGRILMILFKIFMVCLLVALLFALFGTVIGLFAVIVMGGTIFGAWSEFAVSIMALLSVAMLLGLGIYTSLQLIGSRTIKTRAILITLVVWFALTLCTASLVFIAQSDIKSLFDDFKVNKTKISYSSSHSSDDNDNASSERMERLEELISKYP